MAEIGCLNDAYRNKRQQTGSGCYNSQCFHTSILEHPYSPYEIISLHIRRIKKRVFFEKTLFYFLERSFQKELPKMITSSTTAAVNIEEESAGSL